MRRPPEASIARLDLLDIEWHGHPFSLPYLYREGCGGPTILFVHGLGGSKENFYAALQSAALSGCTIVAFDQPGIGLAHYDPAHDLDVSGLADITHEVVSRLIAGPYWLAGASMGGLISLLLIRKFGTEDIRGLINLEGNLCSEDCMFSRRVIAHTLDSFSGPYEQMIVELAGSSFAGDQIIAQNMAMNLDIRAYHAYSFQTVRESDTGKLMEEFLRVPLPKLFLYGAKNRTLSYLPRLRDSDVEVCEVPASAHFLFYDNPQATFQAIGNFINDRSARRNIDTRSPR